METVIRVYVCEENFKTKSQDDLIIDEELFLKLARFWRRISG